MTNHHPVFIQDLIQRVQCLSMGPDLLSLLQTHSVSVKDIGQDPSAIDQTTNIAFLHIDNAQTSLYLSERCEPDDVIHELCHIHHMRGLPGEYVAPADLKHRYITKAMREADAFARQMEAFIETLSDPAVLQREEGIFQQAQHFSAHPDPDADFVAGPCKLYLYTVEQISPRNLMRQLDAGEKNIRDLMLDIFCVVLHDYIPLHYEDFHLMQMDEEVFHRARDGDTITHRGGGCGVHLETDTAFFADCMRLYGEWGRADNYLISPECYGPDPAVFFDTLLNDYVTQALDDMNNEIIGIAPSWARAPEPFAPS